MARVFFGFLKMWWFINFYIAMYDLYNISIWKSILLFLMDRQPRSVYRRVCETTFHRHSTINDLKENVQAFRVTYMHHPRTVTMKRLMVVSV